MPSHDDHPNPLAALVGRVSVEVREPAPDATPTVLLVEDEVALRAVTTRILRKGGFAVEAAEDPEAALRLAAAGSRPDLLLTDVVMPGLSGHELAERVRAHQPHLRVLFMSGFTRNVLERYGVTDEALVEKPFDAPTLLDAVRGALAR